MSAEFGGSQLSSLLESVPGLASVLRSPVADAIVSMIRAGAGLSEFKLSDARELVQYATRRGLIPTAEGARLMEEVEAVVSAGRRRARATKAKGAARKRTAVSKATKKRATQRKAKVAKKQPVKKKPAKKATRAAPRAAKKATKAGKKRR